MYDVVYIVPFLVTTPMCTNKHPQQQRGFNDISLSYMKRAVQYVLCPTYTVCS